MLRGAGAAAVLVVGLMLTLAAPVPALGALLALSVLPALLTRWRLELSRNAQSFIGIGALALGLLAPRPFIDEVFAPPGTLGMQAFTLGAAAYLVAASRLYLAKPVGGVPVTLAAALVALTACGRGDTGMTYAVAIVVFAVLAALAMRHADPARPPAARLGRRQWVGLSLAVTIAGVFAVVSAWAIPKGHEWAMGRITERFLRRTGFSEVMWIGSLEGMLQSDAVVMRVRGAPVSHLRGVVFTSYQKGQWSQEVGPDADGRPRTQQIATPKRPSGQEGGTEVELVGDERRYFTPLHTGVISVATGLANADRYGVLMPLRGNRAKRYWFEPGEAREPPVADPSAADLEIPSRLVPELAELARTWTEGAESDAERLEAIAHHLSSEYQYSLDFTYLGRRDPTLEFLFERRRGHCEYFATAMALLARTLGIRTRVVGGYRVAERNELGGYFVVRERDAHTWVEAWVPDRGWQTFDPTPASAFMEPRRLETPTLTALTDLLATSWERVDDWIAERSTEEFIVALLVLMGLLPLIRWWRERTRGAAERVAADLDPALPCFETLCAMLSKHGLDRGHAEPIERFAERVGEEGPALDWRPEASELLRAYAALRYGGVGDEEDVAMAIRRLCERAR